MRPPPDLAWVRATAEPRLARACLALFFCLALGLCLVPGFNVLNYYASLALALPGSVLAAWMGQQAAVARPDATLVARFAVAARHAMLRLKMWRGASQIFSAA